jgi:hypothetical protein
MQRSEAEHVLRAAAAIAQEQSFIVIGSQRASLHYVGDLTVVCPELHDLALSKCVAGREKDADFVRELLKLDLVSAVALQERAALLDAAKYPVAQIGDWIERRRIEAGKTP